MLAEGHLSRLRHLTSLARRTNHLRVHRSPAKGRIPVHVRTWHVSGLYRCKRRRLGAWSLPAAATIQRLGSVPSPSQAYVTEGYS